MTGTPVLSSQTTVWYGIGSVREVSESMRTLFMASAMLLPALVLGTPTVLAQNSPSADQIIRALRPTGPVQGGTRGIRPAAPAATTAPAAIPVPAPVTPAAAFVPVPQAPPASPAPVQPAPQAAVQATPSIDLTVQFRLGSADLTVEAMRTLDELGRALNSDVLAGYRFRIEGHTDTTGSRSLNLSLSQQRAASVASYLQSRFGVAAARLEAVGRGQDALKVQTPDHTPEPRNRRVQVINIGA